MDNYFSMPGIIEGETLHYNSSGEMIGYSQDDGLSVRHFSVNGQYVGESFDGIVSDQIHIGKDGRYAGSSIRNSFGITDYYGDSGNYVGSSGMGLSADSVGFFDEGSVDSYFDL